MKPKPTLSHTELQLFSTDWNQLNEYCKINKQIRNCLYFNEYADRVYTYTKDISADPN